MAKPRAEYEIKAKDETKAGIQSASGGLSKLSTKAGVAFKSIAKASAVATAAVTAMVFGVSKLVDKFSIQEKAEISLAAAARNNPLINGEAVKGLIDYSAALQKVTTFGDEALIQQASFLTTLQLSQDQIQGVLSAATNLASTGMMSLESAVKNIAKTYGGMAGELGELIPSMRTLTAEQLKNGEAVDLIAENYKGMASAVANSTAGIKEQTKMLFGDMAEKVGEAFAPIQNTILKAVQPAFNAIIKWFSDNQKPITNFFLRFGDIARITMERIGEGFIHMFSWAHAWESIKAIGLYMGTQFKNVAKFIGAVFIALANTIFVPLSNGFEYVVYGMKVAWTATMNALKTGLLWLIDGPVDTLGKAFRSVVGGIGDAISFVLNGIVSIINVAISGINKLNGIGWDAAQKVAHPFDKSKREAYSGADLIKPLGMDFDFEWMKGQNEKLSERIGDLTDALNPNSISLIKNNAQTLEEALGDIGDGWKNAGDISVETYVDNMKAALKMNKTIFADPFIDAFDEFGEEFKGILMSDLPPTAESILNNTEKEVNDAITKAYSGSGFRMKKFFWEKMEDWIKDFTEKFQEGGSLEIVSVAAIAAGSALLSFGKYLLDGLMATEAFTSALEVLGTAISDIFNALVKPLMLVVQPLISILVSFAQSLGNVLLPLIYAVANTLEALMPIISMLADFIGQLLVPIVDVLSIALKIITDLLVQLAPVFKVLFEMILNVLTPVIEFLGQILTALAPVFKLIGDILIALAPVFEAIGTVLASILGPALTFIADLFSAIINPIMTVFAQILMVLTPIFQIFAIIMKAITPIFNVLFQLLSILLIPLQFLGILLELLNPAFQLLGGLVSLLVPVFDVLAKVVDAATRPIEFIGDILQWLGNGLKALGQSIWYLITFQWSKMGDIQWPGAFQSNAFSRPLGSTDTATSTIATPDFADVTFDTPGTGTPGSAGYSPQAANQYGSNQLTVNVTINTEVVTGTDGLRELALLLDNEITKAQALGIA